MTRRRRRTGRGSYIDRYAIDLLDRAAQRGLIDLGTAVARLKATSFRYRQELADALFARGKGGDPNMRDAPATPHESTSLSAPLSKLTIDFM